MIGNTAFLYLLALQLVVQLLSSAFVPSLSSLREYFQCVPGEGRPDDLEKTCDFWSAEEIDQSW